MAKTATLTIRLDEQTKRDLAKVAKETDRTMTEFIVHAVQQAKKKQQAKRGI